MRRRLVVLLAVALVVGLVVVPGSPSAAAEPCDDLPGVTHYGDPLAATTPVVLVHGFTGSSSTWSEHINVTLDDDVPPLSDGRSFIDQLLRIDAVSVWVFDYHDTSARWVTDPSIGPALADLLTCLAANGGQPAVLVVHSMGGLAARYAMGLLPDPTIVSGLVTFGTPHLGSDIASLMSRGLDIVELGYPWGGLLRSVLDSCDEAKTASVESAACGLAGALPPLGSEAGLALQAGSTAVTSLPAVPANVSTLAIAGQIEIVFQAGVGFFYQDLKDVDGGDLVVSVESATHNSGFQWVRQCQLNYKAGYAISDDLRQLLGIGYDDGKEQGITELRSNGCYHSNLTRTVEFTNDALHFINNIAQQQSPRPAACAGAEQLAVDAREYPPLAFPEAAKLAACALVMEAPDLVTGIDQLPPFFADYQPIPPMATGTNWRIECVTTPGTGEVCTVYEGEAGIVVLEFSGAGDFVWPELDYVAPSVVATALDKWFDAEARCRGGLGDDPETWKACDEWPIYTAELASLGWCYGQRANYGYQRMWDVCLE